MKKLLSLALCFVLCFTVCACNNTAPTDGETDTAPVAESSAETTAAETEAASEKIIFDPDDENLEWGITRSGNADANAASFKDDAKSGELCVSEDLREAMETSGDKRIAVWYLPEEIPEGARDPFVNLPADYKDKYGCKLSIGEAYAMTVDEINSLVCDPEARVAVGILSYAEFRLLHLAYYDGTDCGCGTEHPAPEEY